MRLQTIIQFLVSCILSFSVLSAHAGVDISGAVQRMQVDGAGNLWFAMDGATSTSERYCKPGWYGFAMYIPAAHPQYPYYFALLATAVSKGKSVYIANIGVFNGSAACDITQTGFGVVLLQ